jgi:hypothetical protein
MDVIAIVIGETMAAGAPPSRRQASRSVSIWRATGRRTTLFSS